MEPSNSTSLPAADKPAKFVRRTLSFEKWTEERIRRFGPDANDAKFVCPICRYVQSVRECRAAGMPDDCIGFSCIGRWIGGSRDAFGAPASSPGPCNYAGGGLFRLNPVTVQLSNGNRIELFEFDGVDRLAPE
jgi:hypothetical protein